MKPINFLFLILFAACGKAQIPVNGSGQTIPVNGNGTAITIVEDGGEGPPESDTVEFYILAGQSNVGRARTSLMTSEQQTLYVGLVADTRIFNPYISTSSLSLMNVGINTMLADANSIDEFGCEASLFKNLQDSDPKARVLLKYGDGATTMRSFWSSRSPKPGWINLLAYTETVVSLLVAEGKIPILKAFIFMQGEGDAGSESFANQYYGRLTDFNTDFRAFWQGIITDNSLPAHDYLFVVGRINSPTSAFRTIVRTAQFDFCQIPANDAVMIDTDSYPLFDIVHYNETGQIQFGIDIFNILP